MGFASGRGWLRSIVCAAALAAGGLAQSARADTTTDARRFLDELWPAARAQGIARTVFDRATASFVPDPEIMELANRQPEYAKPVGAYITDLVTAERVAAGRQLAVTHAPLLRAIEAAYGVDGHILLAIWGVESAYGTRRGDRHVIRSLATLAMVDDRRGAFWRKELLAALRILQQGATTPERLVGSWAGAMGHTQFMPSTYAAFAVDFNKDGRRDIWDDVGDALASTAGYLQRSGWRAGRPWGFEVTLPVRFDYGWSAPGRVRAVADWLAEGITLPRARGGALSLSEPMRLLLPAGARGPAFLVTANFRALLRYNNSVSYALAVAHLADRIEGGAPFATSWPVSDTPLSLSEREELQELLARRGHAVGSPDGIIGDQTRAAIRATQRTLNLMEDGHPSSELLLRLRQTNNR